MLVFSCLLGLMLMAFTLAYLLPALPLIYWIAGLLGYISFFLEVCFAIQMWLVAMVKTGDSHKFVPKSARKGGLILFHFIARPALMLIGLVAGLGIANALGWFADLVTVNAISSAYGTTLLGFIAIMAVYVAIFTMIIWRSIELINVFPDAVLEWIDARGSDMYQVNAAAKDHGTAAIMGMRQHIQSGGHSAVYGLNRPGAVKTPGGKPEGDGKGGGNRSGGEG